MPRIFYILIATLTLSTQASEVPTDIIYKCLETEYGYISRSLHGGIETYTKHMRFKTSECSGHLHERASKAPEGLRLCSILQHHSSHEVGSSLDAEQGNELRRFYNLKAEFERLERRNA